MTLNFCEFQPRAEIVYVIVNIFSPFNRTGFNPRDEKAPCEALVYTQIASGQSL